MPIRSLYARRRSLGTTLLPAGNDMDEETKAESRHRLATVTANPQRRSSIAQFLFGQSSSQSNLAATSNCSLKAPSQTSILSTGSTSTRIRRRRSRPSIAIPVDSRSKHSFHSDSGSNTEDEAFVDDDQQQTLAESIEAFLATRRQSQVAPKPSVAAPVKSVMRRTMRVVVAGGRKTGKTAMLQQLACYKDVSTLPYVPTIDDTYQIQTQVDAHDASRPREMIIFHDTAGVSDYGAAEIRRPYLQVADAFILVYSVVDHESFNRMDVLKRFIEKHYVKEKKDIPIVVVGTMTDLPGRKVDAEFANTWANKERVKLFEVSTTNRATLVDIVHYLAGRHFHPIKESKFSLSKKLRPEKSNAGTQQILTDI